MAIQDNLLLEEMVDNPYPYFRQLQSEDPVHWNELWGGWILTRYDDVAAAFQDSRLSAARMKPSKSMNEGKAQEMSSTFDILSKWMVFTDPPNHTRLRMISNQAFTPRAIQAMRGRIQGLSEKLLRDFQGAGRMDVMRDYAFHLPILVISDMLGLPPEDRNLLKKWSDDLLLLVFGAVNARDRYEKAHRSLSAMADYLRDAVEKRRKKPQDDLISAMVQAEEKGELLTTEEAVATCTLLVFGGHETTTNLICNGLLALLQNPDQLQLLRDQPSTISTAIEEMLRYDGPSKAMIRVAKEDIQLRDKKIHKGDRLLLVQAAANRDPLQFEEPDRFLIQRQPNPHLGFGRGIHYCMGAPLARLEGEIAIKELVERFPNMQLTGESLQWQPTMINRGLKSLPVNI